MTARSNEMKNITLSIDDKELEDSRRYAQQQGQSLNSMIRELLRRTVRSSSKNWMDDCFELMDRAKVKTKNVKTWKREDLYDV
jgi:hypothetical protein